MPQQKLYEVPLTLCEKKRYSSIGEAERQRFVLASIANRLCPYAPALKVHYCVRCNSYHVGPTS